MIVSFAKSSYRGMNRPLFAASGQVPQAFLKIMDVGVNADCQVVSFQFRLQHKESVTLTQSELTNRS